MGSVERGSNDPLPPTFHEQEMCLSHLTHLLFVFIKATTAIDRKMILILFFVASTKLRK